MGYPGEDVVRIGEIVSLLAASTPAEGANETAWPGLVFYRFERPVPAHWDAVSTLSLCVVAQGRKRVRIGSADHHYDPLHYLVMARGLSFQAEILEGSPVKPFLSFVLQTPPEVVSEILTQMHRTSPALFYRGGPPRSPSAYVTALNQPVLRAIHRFLTVLDDDTERTVLGPMYLREIVYRLLYADQCYKLVRAASEDAPANRVSTAIAFMRENLAEPISVSDVAEVACMSPSAFAHLFSDAVGVSPYQFLKDLRLDTARVALTQDGASVSEAAASVGYSSLSHFISEFKRRYGDTPKAYVQRLQDTATLSVAETPSG